MSPLESAKVLPCSDDRSRASESNSCCTRSRNLIMTRARRCGLTAAQAGCAASATAMACSTSECLANATLACTSPVFGLNTSPWRPDVPLTCLPPMKWPISRIAFSLKALIRPPKRSRLPPLCCFFPCRSRGRRAWLRRTFTLPRSGNPPLSPPTLRLRPAGLLGPAVAWVGLRYGHCHRPWPARRGRRAVHAHPDGWRPQDVSRHARGHRHFRRLVCSDSDPLPVDLDLSRLAAWRPVRVQHAPDYPAQTG